MAGVWHLYRTCMARVWQAYGTCTYRMSMHPAAGLTARCTCDSGNARAGWVRVLALMILVTAVPGCAVKGYDLGWRVEDRFTNHLGTPLDAASGCRWRQDAEARAAIACDGVIAALDREAAGLRQLEGQSGMRCQGTICSYRNVYERRDLGLALVVPVYRKIVVREVRARFEKTEGRWRVTEVIVVDTPPPNYGPVTIGG